MAATPNPTTTGTTGEINLTKKADKKVLERFKLKSVTQGLFSNAYSFTGVQTVQIPSVDTVPLGDYNAELNTGASRYGSLVNLGDSVQEFTMRENKSFIFAIDETYNTDQQQIKRAGECLRREVDEVVIPYVDKYRLTQLASAADTSDVVSLSATPTKSNIIETIFNANAMMSDEMVPVEGRVLYMSYQDAVMLKLADQVVGIDKLGEKAIVNGVFGKIDATQIRLVPQSYMTAAGVKILIVKTGIALAPTKIKKYAIHDGTYVLNGKIVTGQLYHDCFVLAKGEKDTTTNKQKVRGIVTINW